MVAEANDTEASCDDGRLVLLDPVAAVAPNRLDEMIAVADQMLLRPLPTWRKPLPPTTRPPRPIASDRGSMTERRAPTCGAVPKTSGYPLTVSSPVLQTTR